MMKKYFQGKQTLLLVCLLLVAGILFLNCSVSVKAAERTPFFDRGESNLTGTDDTRTNIEEPGASRDSDELKELNVANNLTIT